MRIIAGEFRRRTLHTSPDSETTRPTTDRARETIFNILNNLVEWEGLTVLDLFAGSGSLGLEALSRGAKTAAFVERDRNAILALMTTVHELKIEGRVITHIDEVAHFLRHPHRGRFGLIFADPPYDDDATRKNLPTLIASQGVLESNGLFVMEHRSSTPPPPSLPGLEAQRTVKVGEASFTIFRSVLDE